jgi:copper oxidase (laccase) domain-containing protein
MERRSLDGGITALFATDLERDGFVVAFTERTGGRSDGAFSTLNLSLGCGDRPEAVGENRRRVCRALGLEPFVLAEQVHGAEVAAVAPGSAAGGC